ncbi:MAG TPA: cytochrome c3 family protein [Planctomycetota bacterium]|nr:cytochrome c3 family protein [Planctomycetota bacterium]
MPRAPIRGLFAFSWRQRLAPARARLLGLGAATIVALTTAARHAEPARRSTPLLDEPKEAAFTHSKHVPQAWVLGSPERYRDCRGCHSYVRGKMHDPQAVCTHCHFSDATNQYRFDLSKSKPGFERDLASVRTPGSLFNHTIHLALECRECHKPAGERVEAPQWMPTTAGSALCTECHGTTPRRNLAALRFMADVPEPQRAAARERLKMALVDALNRSPTMGPNQGGTIYVGRFLHADHIAPERIGEATPLAALKAGRAGDATSNCASCHAPMFEAAAGFPGAADGRAFAVFQQTPAACGTCHIADERRTPVVYTTEPTTHASLVASTFSHATHLAAAAAPPAVGALASAAAHRQVQEQGCAACHAYERKRGETFGVRSDRASFAGCQTCHDNAPWALPPHDGWSLTRDHGAWQRCTVCHPGGNADYQHARPVAQVRRRRPGTFHIDSQAHPFITTKPRETTARDCAECHRGRIVQLPSRVADAPFRHSAHLPDKPTAAACARCHDSRIVPTVTSGEIGTVAAGPNGQRIDLIANLANGPGAKDLVGLTYDPAACTACHLGSPPVPMRSYAAYEQEAARPVVEFSHGRHLGKPGGIGCLDCHAFDATDVAAPVTTLPDALDCTKCHDHGDRAATSSGVTAAEVRGCRQCHQRGVPAPTDEAHTPTFSIPALRITDIAGGARQFHPATDRCDTCHVTMTGAELRIPSASQVVATRTFYQPNNAATAKTAIHRGNTSKFTGDRIDCFLCHWTKAYAQSAQERGGTTNPETELIRSRQGDDLSRYPGGE